MNGGCVAKYTHAAVNDCGTRGQVVMWIQVGAGKVGWSGSGTPGVGTTTRAYAGGMRSTPRRRWPLQDWPERNDCPTVGGNPQLPYVWHPPCPLPPHPTVVIDTPGLSVIPPELDVYVWWGGGGGCSCWCLWTPFMFIKHGGSHGGSGGWG